MKKHILIIILAITSITTNAQNCFWAKKAGATNSDQSHAITTDVNGNVFVTGDFIGSITFGSTTLTDGGSGGYFIVKYSPSGIVQWAQNINGYGTSLATDNVGNLYVTGNYVGTKTFGSTTLISLGSSDVFIEKIDPSGVVLWAKSAGGASNDDSGTAITFDGGANIYLTGNYRSDSIKFGTFSLNNIGTNNTDLFIAKYTASTGTFIWAKRAGGNRYDYGNGIVSDANKNAYVSGSFSSDSIKFGTSPTLISSASGATNMFIAKYDSTGTVVWSKKIECLWGDLIAYEIKTDGTNLYTSGEFQGVSVKFGSDSLINNSSGSTDMFVAKYDFNGNAIWGRSAGGANYDYSKNLSVDAAGNVYTLGTFTSATFLFGTDTSINNTSASAQADIFLAKYNTNGNFLWTQKIGGLGADWARGIAVGLAADVYFTGDFDSAPLLFGTTSLTTSGMKDIFVADIFQFSSGISSSVNVSCFGANDGSAISFATGGHLPYSYSWNSTPTQTTSAASNLVAGTYNVTITEGYGCAQVSSVTLTEPPADMATICMVTVDSLSQYNVIIWDKTSFTTVDSFIIYREITTGNYSPIGSVSFDSLSQFVDTTRYMYFPNTGNPNNGTYRYKIEALSTCGTTGPISPYHNTIYILNTSGTFTWPQLYGIEGGANPVSNYVLMRDDSTNGNWNAVASVAGTQQIINDPLYSTYQNTASWRVETIWNISCTPTRSYSSSYSNICTNVTTSMQENLTSDFVNIYPNPYLSETNITYTLKNTATINLEVFNTIGQKIETLANGSQQAGNYKYNFNAKEKGYDAGVYFVKITVNGKSIMKKIIEVK